MSRYVASNPGGIRVDIVHFLKCDGKDVIILAVALLAGGAITAINWKLGLTIMAIGAFVPLSSLFSVPQIFREGDACPAVVIDPDRQLVAVFTDLSKGGRPKPVVKVVKQPLRRAVKKPVKKGTRLAYIAMYNGFDGSPNWLNFGGYLADMGTGSAKAIQRVVSSIAESDWEKLLKAVGGLEKPYSQGLFEIQAGKRSEGGTVRTVRKRSVRTSLKIAGGVVAALVLLPVLAGLLGGGMKLAGGPAAPANGGGANNPVPVPVPVPLAAPPAPVVNNPPAMHPPAVGWTPPSPPGPPIVQPPQVAREQPSTETNDATEPVADASPFRPKVAEANVSPFRPKPAAPAESPFRPKATTSDTATVEPGDESNASVDSERAWRAGDKAEALYGSQWLPVTILAVQGNEGFKVHWDGWSDKWDEVLPPSRLRSIQGK